MTDEDDKQVQEHGSFHDAYFQKIFKERKNANALLRDNLPQEITDLFAPDLPKVISGTFFDERLSRHLSDILFEVKLKNGSSACIYALVEHKSSPDALVSLQLLKYMSRIWADWIKDNENKKKNKEKYLPVIIPMVLYHGQRRWKVPTSFAPLFGDIPEILRPYIPDFTHELTDLGEINDQNLSTDKRLAALLRPMKYIFTTEIMLHLKGKDDELLKLDQVDIVAWMAYVLKVRTDIEQEDIKGVMEHLPALEREEIMAGLAQEFRDEWYNKGQIEGKVEGKAELLMEQLEYAFGSLSNDVKEKIMKADLDTLRLWGKKILKASSLDDIFNSNK